jgi:hypothetical protein
MDVPTLLERIKTVLFGLVTPRLAGSVLVARTTIARRGVFCLRVECRKDGGGLFAFVKVSVPGSTHRIMLTELEFEKLTTELSDVVAADSS